MAKINSIALSPEPIDEAIHAKAVPLPIAIKPKLLELFKSELLRPKSPLSMILVTLPNRPYVIAHLSKVGQTAAIVKWMRYAGHKADTSGKLGVDQIENEPQMEFDIEASSLMMSGIDQSEDEEALRLLKSEIPNSWYPPRAYELLRSEPRPLCATLNGSIGAYYDQAIRVSAECLSEAFFDQFGLH